ncbi:MAG: peptide-binding protein [Candidatus Omnitrophica bacterium]|nr:peptide-binding protein [Candidatus Omnitrophota bacterium]
MRLGAFWTALLLIASTALAGNAADGQKGDVLVSGSVGEPSTLVPILAADSASGAICGLVFNGLVKYDRDLRIVGSLAYRWDLLDGGLTLIFHLRAGVRWHDGHPFTAEDVEFTYRSLIDPNVRTPYSEDFLRVQAFEVLDPYTIRVTYKEPFAPGLSSWGMNVMPKHLLAGQDLQTTAFRRSPIGTGPYRFKRWVTADRIELEANPDYFEGSPKIQGWIERIIPDPATLFLELQAEGVDLADLTPLQYKRQTQTPFFQSHYQKFRYPSFSYTYLGYNLTLPIFSDLRVRQALNCAIDKEELVRGCLLGLGRVATGPFLPESWAYNPDVQAVPYDPRKAEALLAEAGWKDTDNDGWLDQKGRRFEFTVLTNKNLTREMSAQIIQRRLKEIGIKVNVRVLEWSSFLNNFIHPRQYEAVLLGWSLGQDPDLYDLWHSSKTKAGEFNFVGYKNSEVDQLLKDGRRTFDQAERARIYREIHRILYEEQPYCFLYVPDALPIVHARIKGIVPAPAGISHNMIEWHVPKHERKYEY